MRERSPGAPTGRGTDPEIGGPFRPAWWLPGAHPQSMYDRLIRRGPRVEMRRETWETPDGDVLEIDRLDGPPGSPLLLGLHGLEGCSRSLYMQGMMSDARDRGWRGVVLNFRSCAPPPGRPRGEWRMNRGRRMYHSGETGDLGRVIDRLRESEPDAPIVSVGVSLGGNVLLKWLGERGSDAVDRVEAAVAMSAPFDLAACADALESGIGYVYMHAFLSTLREKALAFERRYPGSVDVEGVRRARTFRHIDDAATAPIHGFEDADDYYARSSSLPYLGRIRVPTLLLNARDDPFQPAEALDRARAAASEAVTCRFTEKGGHVGWMSGPPWNPTPWAEVTAIDWLAGRLEADGSTG